MLTQIGFLPVNINETKKREKEAYNQFIIEGSRLILARLIYLKVINEAVNESISVHIFMIR